jgi:hypothetical protein
MFSNPTKSFQVRLCCGLSRRIELKSCLSSASRLYSLDLMPSSFPSARLKLAPTLAFVHGLLGYSLSLVVTPLRGMSSLFIGLGTTACLTIPGIILLIIFLPSFSRESEVSLAAPSFRCFSTCSLNEPPMLSLESKPLRLNESLFGCRYGNVQATGSAKMYDARSSPLKTWCCNF